MSHSAVEKTSSHPHWFTLFQWAIRHFWARKRNRWLLMTFAILAAVSHGLGAVQALKVRQEISDLREMEAERNEVYRSAFTTDEPNNDDSKAQRKIRTQRMIAKLPTSLAYSGGIDSASYLPRPIAILSVGYSDIWPSRYRITAHSRRQNLEREDIASPFRRLTGPWDAAAFILIILPLTLIVLTYDIVSSEQELGTLSLLQLNVQEIRIYFLFRFLVCGLGLGGLLIGIHVFTALLFSSPAAVSLGLWCLFVAVYTAFWLGLAWAINALKISSVASVMLLTLLWALLTIAFPTTLARLAEKQFPVIENTYLITQERLLREQAENDSRRLLDAYYDTHPEVIRPSKKEDPYGQTRWDAIREEVDRQMQPLLATRISQIQQRRLVVERLSLLDPALAAKTVMDELAGTGLYQYATFVEHALHYDEQFKSYFQPLMMQRGELTEKSFAAIPAFAERTDDMPLRLSLLLQCNLAIVAWTAGLFLFGWIRLRKV